MRARMRRTATPTRRAVGGSPRLRHVTAITTSRFRGRPTRSQRAADAAS